MPNYLKLLKINIVLIKMGFNKVKLKNNKNLNIKLPKMGIYWVKVSI